MKKLNLKSLGIEAGELLTRAQMKNVFGGDFDGGSGTAGGSTKKKTACEQQGGECRTCYEKWCYGLVYCSNGMGQC